MCWPGSGGRGTVGRREAPKRGATGSLATLAPDRGSHHSTAHGSIADDIRRAASLDDISDYGSDAASSLSPLGPQKKTRYRRIVHRPGWRFGSGHRDGWRRLRQARGQRRIRRRDGWRSPRSVRWGAWASIFAESHWAKPSASNSASGWASRSCSSALSKRRALTALAVAFAANHRNRAASRSWLLRTSYASIVLFTSDGAGFGKEGRANGAAAHPTLVLRGSTAVAVRDDLVRPGVRRRSQRSSPSGASASTSASLGNVGTGLIFSRIPRSR